MEKTLAICIPTYNRAALLAKNLDVLVPLAQASDCPIYISDNASPDDTEKVVGEARKQYEKIYYVQQRENIGFCRNFEYVVNMAEADYVWLLGDDDYIAEGCIEKVLCDFKEHEDACMVVANAGNNPSSLRIKDLKSQIICGKDAIMSEIGAHMTWMSCLVFNKRIVGSVHFNQYEGNAFPHLWWILANLTDQSKIYWESNSCIGSFGGGHQMSDFFKVFFADWHDAVYGVEGYAETARGKCFNDGVAYAFTRRELIKLRAKGDLNKNTWQEYRAYFEQLSDDKQKLIKLLLMMPESVCKVAIEVYKKRKTEKLMIIL
jgi:glycosyltransferase involved in cell wall biosynthesis